jgi:hypothetical protein
MGLTPVVTQSATNRPQSTGSARSDAPDWIGMAAGGSLIAAGLLLFAGKRRAAMAAAAAGTSLAMLEQQDLLRTLWKQLPGYVDQVQQAISQVRSTVEEFTVKAASGPHPVSNPDKD